MMSSPHTVDLTGDGILDGIIKFQFHRRLLMPEAVQNRMILRINDVILKSRSKDFIEIHRGPLRCRTYILLRRLDRVATDGLV